MTERIPPARWITRENATVFEIDEDLFPRRSSFNGFPWPVDDGNDDPEWEYQTARTLDWTTLRVPVRRRNDR